MKPADPVEVGDNGASNAKDACWEEAMKDYGRERHFERHVFERKNRKAIFCLLRMNTFLNFKKSFSDAVGFESLCVRAITVSLNF